MEPTDTNREEAERLLGEWLVAMGIDGDAELAETPRRVTTLMRGFLRSGPPPAVSTFPVDAIGPVILRDLPFHSLCVHHFLPFFGTATVAYVPGVCIAGFGSIAAVLDHHARRPQLQERLVREVLDTLWEALSPRALCVRTKARHLCMEMRGARKTGEVEVLADRGDEESLRLLRAL